MAEVSFVGEVRVISDSAVFTPFLLSRYALITFFPDADEPFASIELDHGNTTVLNLATLRNTRNSDARTTIFMVGNDTVIVTIEEPRMHRHFNELLRRIGTEVPEQPLSAPAAGNVPGGLDQNRPNIVVSPVQPSPGRRALNEALSCSICVCVMHNTVTVWPCSHKFCAGCIVEWRERHNDCPLCRRPLERLCKDRYTNGIIDAYLQSNPQARRPQAELDALDRRTAAVIFDAPGDAEARPIAAAPAPEENEAIALIDDLFQHGDGGGEGEEIYNSDDDDLPEDDENEGESDENEVEERNSVDAAQVDSDDSMAFESDQDEDNPDDDGSDENEPDDNNSAVHSPGPVSPVAANYDSEASMGEPDDHDNGGEADVGSDDGSVVDNDENSNDGEVDFPDFNAVDSPSRVSPAAANYDSEASSLGEPDDHDDGASDNPGSVSPATESDGEAEFDDNSDNGEQDMSDENESDENSNDDGAANDSDETERYFLVDDGQMIDGSSESDDSDASDGPVMPLNRFPQITFASPHRMHLRRRHDDDNAATAAKRVCLQRS